MAIALKGVSSFAGWITQDDNLHRYFSAWAESVNFHIQRFIHGLIVAGHDINRRYCMAMMTRPECSGEMSEEASACPKCGWKKKKTKWWLWIPLGLVAAFLGFGMTIGDTEEGRAKSRDRDVINLCWSDQKRKSLDASTQRFVASTCEALEEKFKSKYGHAP